MEYEFLQDLDGQVIVRMSMDHEALGYWFNEEVSHQPELLTTLLNAAHQIKGTDQQWHYTGHEYTLWLSEASVIVQANVLSVEQTLPEEEGLNYYDAESYASCGLDDFVAVLTAYKDFLGLQD